MLEQMLFPEIVRGKFKQVFVFVCGILGEEANIVFELIGKMLQGQWDWSECDYWTANLIADSWKETGNAKGMAKTLCSFLPFSRPLHVWSRSQCDALCDVLKECSELPKELTVAEVHISPYVPCDRWCHLMNVLEDVNKPLGPKLTLTWFADAWKVPYFELSSVRLRICGSLGSSSLQDVEDFLLQKCLSSLSITVCGDVQEALVEALARGLAGESNVKFLDLCVIGNFSFRGASLLEQGILRNRSLRNIKVSVNGEPPENWQAVAKNLRAQFAEKAIVSEIYPNTWSKVKDSQLRHLNWFLISDLKQQTVTLNVWSELSGDGFKAVCDVLLHTPVSHLTLNIHGQLTSEMLRYIARCVEEQEKLSPITINAWVELTEKENKLIKELGLDKNPSFSLNVCGTSAPLKESSDSTVFPSDEPQSLIALFEKATKSPSSEFTEDTSQKSPTIKINDGKSNEWEHGLSERLAGNTSLKSLTLEFDNGDDNDEWGRGLGEVLARNTSLKSLKIIVRANSTSNESLKSLTLEFDDYSYHTVECGHGLGEWLAGNTSLKSLTLVIDDCGDDYDEWGRGLGEGLARNTSLESLTISFNAFCTSHRWEYCLGEGLARNTSLKSLTLEIDENAAGNHDWRHGLFESLARNTSLESLTLAINYGECWRNDEWGYVLGEILAKNNSLNSLTLTINKYNYMEGDWDVALAEILARNTSLKSITFTMNNYLYMSSLWALGVFEGSARNTSLKSITLTINNYGDMEGEWRHDVIEGLARNASLKSITLAINNYGDMEGEWGHCLFEGLARNTSLNSLTLTANDYGDMSEEWGCALRRRLRKRESMTECNLIVDICGKC
ncbi:uncharacterized protein LOC122955375 [Acropora millepora]|uniref:uncharacterized protein LOC122955374 n=1 Tax=Acropora millepora TaxID=45264 RepID=UPI001CF2AA8C|nr:uncharacterized protein LOC122955374 [Acropora millepora]XP_044171117.1 uncharacterized protein LOC122955375 [Acropora millepora]